MTALPVLDLYNLHFKAAFKSLSEHYLVLYVLGMIMFYFAIYSQLSISQSEKYQEKQHFLGSGKPRILFSRSINVKMPTIVGIVTFMSRKNFMLS